MSSAKQYNLPSYPVIPTVAVSSGNVTSLVTDVDKKDVLLYQCVWTGTLAGTFSVETSNTYKPNANGIPNGTPLVAGSWDVLPITGATAAGVAGSGSIELAEIGAPYIRLVFTYTSGSGNLTVTLNGKAI